MKVVPWEAADLRREILGMSASDSGRSIWCKSRTVNRAPSDVLCRGGERSRYRSLRPLHIAYAGADLVEAFGIPNIPATFLIDPAGTIVRLDLRGQGLDQALGQLLK